MIIISDFTRISSDTNGNPRYVCHYLKLLKDGQNTYGQALLNARQFGGKKFHNKQYGGGIAFQCYNLQSLCDKINAFLQ